MRRFRNGAPMRNRADAWPADALEAREILERRVLMAFYNIDPGRSAATDAPARPQPKPAH